MSQREIPTANLERIFRLNKRGGVIDMPLLKKATALSLSKRIDGDPTIKKQAEKYLERHGWY